MQKLLSIALVFILSSCAEFPGVYKVDIEQGNILTKEMISQLAKGQTKEQVQFILGSPPVSDTFSDNRWDYIYRLKKGDEFIQKSNITVLFKDGLVESFTVDGVTREH